MFAVSLTASQLAGCGPSQEEFDAKVREIEKLKSALSAEQEQNKKAQLELSDAQARIEQLKEQLKNAGVDISNLNANLEQQARALEDYKKRAEQLEAIRKKFELLKQKLDALTKLGLKVVIRNDPGLAARTFQVAGHTDSQALNGGQFKDNWGLSAMRAREVLTYLIGPVDKGGGGLQPNQWSAVGYGETDPIQSNDTPEGRQANRRVELVVMPNVEEMIDLKTLTK
jgi:chemotaxis protein MotB